MWPTSSVETVCVPALTAVFHLAFCPSLCFSVSQGPFRLRCKFIIPVLFFFPLFPLPFSSLSPILPLHPLPLATTDLFSVSITYYYF